MTLQIDVQANPLVRGSIDKIRGNLLYGWIFSAIPSVRPFVLVDNASAELVERNVSRRDVCEAFGMADSWKAGFIFRLPSAPAGARVCLYGAHSGGVCKIAEYVLKQPLIETNLFAQLEQAAKIAREPGAVGIVCWDGAHDSIVRAKNLYDIASTRRPVVLVCYLHREFGGELWPSLVNWDGAVIALPWDRRNAGHDLLARYGIAFDTVWICKPCLPSFMLASAIARNSSRFLLDIENDEETVPGGNSAATACYEASGANLARLLMDGTHVRTVSGPGLQRKFGGWIVRPARRPSSAHKMPDGIIKKVVFCGTVSQHENIAALARAVAILAAGENMKLEFHVFGDRLSRECIRDLREAGAQVHGSAAPAEIDEAIAMADVLISGFAPDKQEWESAGSSQMSPLIFDALAAGKPVLLHESDDASGLETIPGVYVFNDSDFLGQLLAAIKHEGKIALPHAFTLEGACLAFEEAEKQALCEKLIVFPSRQGELNKPDPTLVLVWKQRDAGLYGRRIDQIARSCKKRYPDYKVIVLEFVNKSEQAATETDGISAQPEDFCDEKYALAEWLAQKERGVEKDGIVYRAIAWDNAPNLRYEFSLLLERQNLLPKNSLFILFPGIEPLDDIAHLLRPFRKMADIVDNEFGWSKSDVKSAKLMEQYFRLMQMVEHVIFNNRITRDYFVRHNCVHESATSVIPNWYTLPDGTGIKRSHSTGKIKNILYSGNMNDRIDWQLLLSISVLPDVTLHLAGTARKSRDKLYALMENGVIYHGVLQEKQTLALLETMDATIIPHIENNLSRYMDPIKTGMYRAAKLPIIAPAWLELAGDDVCTYNSIRECMDIIANPGLQTPCFVQPNSSAIDAYMNLLEI